MLKWCLKLLERKSACSKADISRTRSYRLTDFFVRKFHQQILDLLFLKLSFMCVILSISAEPGPHGVLPQHRDYL